MTARGVVALAAGASFLLAVAPALPVTIADCERWMDQLRAEAGGAVITGEEGDEERRTLIESVDQVRGEGVRGNRAAVDDTVKRFQKRAASLAAKGTLSRMEGERLYNLSEAVRRCVEHAQQSE